MCNGFIVESIRLKNHGFTHKKTVHIASTEHLYCIAQQNLTLFNDRIFMLEIWM